MMFEYKTTEELRKELKNCYRLLELKGVSKRTKKSLQSDIASIQKVLETRIN
jgi:hypothetical protein